jgi:hypothetical protein
MYFFSYYGTLCLLKEAYYHKHDIYRMPSTFKNEFNPDYRTKKLWIKRTFEKFRTLKD